MSRSAAEQKLRSSGITHTLEELRMRVCSAAETAAIAPNFYELPSLIINYIDPWTGEPMRRMPKWPPFFRARMLGEPTALKAKEKFRKYLQPEGTGSCAYFAPFHPWRELLATDRPTSIVITEGELKAIKACEMGITTIGLGGVDNIYSRGQGLGLLPELDRIDWAQRNAYIIFDNDGKPNPNVFAAANRLAGELYQRGALVYWVALPPPVNGSKMGLDDYLMAHTREDFNELVLGTRESFTAAAELWKMNKKFVKVRFPNVVLDRHDNALLKPPEFTAHYDNRTTPELLLNKAGDMSYKQVPLASRWLSWPQRAEVMSITYAPGQQEYSEGTLNLWKGWGCQPAKGDVKPFLALLDSIFGPTDEGKHARKWFLQWTAYPIQHPGTKLLTAALLWSLEHGTGKTLLGYVLQNIYGEANSTEIGQKHMHSDFNSWAEHRQLVICDEITGTDKKELSDRIKAMITQRKVRINTKNIAEYELPNCANFYMTSNKPSALYLEDDDRRFFVWEVTNKAPLAFFNAFDLYYRSPDGMSAIHHYLLNVDLEGFSPNAPAPNTSAKAAMQEDCQTDHGAWCRSLRADPDAALAVMGMLSDLYTNGELLALYQKTSLTLGSSRLTATTLGNELKMAGIRQLPVTKVDGRAARLYIVRNQALWLKASPDKIRKHLHETKPRVSGYRPVLV